MLHKTNVFYLLLKTILLEKSLYKPTESEAKSGLNLTDGRFVRFPNLYNNNQIHFVTVCHTVLYIVNDLQQ